MLFMRKVTHFILLVGISLILMGEASVDMAAIEEAFLKKDFPVVQNLSQDFLQKNRGHSYDSSKAQLYLGLSLLNQSKYLRARSIFSPLSETASDEAIRSQAFLGLMDSFFMDGHYLDVIQVGKKVIRKYPHSDFYSQICLKLARAHLKLAQWDKAKDYLNDIIDHYKNSPEFFSAAQLLEEKQYFTVQVGSFADRVFAENLVAELSQKGEYAYIVETNDQQGKALYRVRVGQLAVLNDAQVLKTKLTSLGYSAQIFP